MARDGFRPPWLLRHAHVQSILAGSGLRRGLVARRAGALIAQSTPRIIECADGVRLLAHLTPPPAAPGRVAVLLHGWEGNSESLYMLSAAARLHAEGYRVVRLNMRDHGDSHHLNRGLFHSCRLPEMIDAVRRVALDHAGERLFLAGWSLGGNFALRIAAAAADLPLARVAAVCPVLDPADTLRVIDNGLFVYRHYFIRKWCRSLAKKAVAFPGVYDFGELGRFRTLTAMTEFFVTRHAGFPDLDTYLRGYAITGDRLAPLRVASRILLADDDPVIPVAGVARLARPAALTVQRTRHGGHCGYLGGAVLTSWLDDWLVAAFS